MGLLFGFAEFDNERKMEKNREGYVRTEIREEEAEELNSILSAGGLTDLTDIALWLTLCGLLYRLSI